MERDCVDGEVWLSLVSRLRKLPGSNRANPIGTGRWG